MNIAETLADTLISKMPDTKNDLQGWLVLAIVSVFLVLFFYMVVRFTSRCTREQLNAVTRLLDGYFSNFTVILIGLQNGNIKLLEVNTAVDIFKAVLKGHCYSKVEIMVKSMNDTTCKDIDIVKKSINQKFMELTQMESNLLNKITYQGGYLGYWLEEFINNEWSHYMSGIYSMVDKYWDKRNIEEMRTEVFNMLWTLVEKLAEKIREEKSTNLKGDKICLI